MWRACDNKQTNIVTEALSIVHCRGRFAFCIMLTKRRAGLLKLEWVSLSVIAIKSEEQENWRQTLLTQALADQFWMRWRREYLPSLLHRVKWSEERRNLKVGDVVLMLEESAPRGFWPLAREPLKFSREVTVKYRSVEVKTGSGAVCRRPTAKNMPLRRVI